MDNLGWECECGHIEYSPLPPEECEKCYRLDSFIQLSEELVEERAKDMEIEEIPIKKTKSKTAGRKKR